MDANFNGTKIAYTVDDEARVFSLSGTPRDAEDISIAHDSKALRFLSDELLLFLKNDISKSDQTNVFLYNAS